MFIDLKYWFLYWFGDRFVVNKTVKIIKKLYKKGYDIPIIKRNAIVNLNKNLVSTCRSDVLINAQRYNKYKYRIKIMLYYPNCRIKNKQFYL